MICKGIVLKFCVVLLMAAYALPSEAQKTFRVKITPRGGAVVKGMLLRADKDSIVVLGKNNQRNSFHLRDVASVGVRRKGAISKGAGIGFLVGSAVGASLALVSHSSCTSYCLSTEASAIYGAMFIGTVGAVIGAVANVGHKRFDMQKGPKQIDDFLWQVKK